ncbi:MAG: radical SAM protein [Bacteroides sp.]|nr:radical SAM protein [Bacteroides sp.]
MKLSQYNIDVSNGSTVLVFNTRTGNYVLFPKFLLEDFLSLSFDANTLEKFESLGFYVNNSIDEFTLLQEDCNKRLKDSNIHKLRILTTTGCNAKCPYCYEKGIQPFFMTKTVAQNIVNFITSEIKSGDKIRVEWFGGEPLLNIKAIDYISSQIRLSIPDGANFASNMITNGYLITPEILVKMKNDWNLKQIQITLDGEGASYERVKGLGNGSFDRIINNIELLVRNNIKVDIRINFGADNIHEINKLLDYLSRLPYKDKLNVYPAKIFSSTTTRGYFDLEEETIQINRLFKKYGFRRGATLIPRAFHTSCMASYPHFYTISPKGKIFKCDRQFLDKDSIADVKDKPLSSELIQFVKSNMSVSAKCKKCKLYPLCWGGCFYDRENGIYPCYLTKRIVEESLLMALDDLEK